MDRYCPEPRVRMEKDLPPWKVHSTPLLGVCWIGNRFLAVGWHGLVLESQDGSHWDSVSIPTPLPLTSCTHGKNLLVVVGARQSIWVSKGDGTFQEVHGGRDQRGLWQVVHGHGRYLAVGMEGLALTSQDGYKWHLLNLGVEANLWGAAFGQGQFVVVGDRVILVSRDGIRFEKHPAPGILNAVTYAEGLWVAVGWGGLILTSQDGQTWKEQASWTWKGLFGVTYGRGTWVVVGEQGTVLASKDGQAWQRGQLEGKPFLTDVAWNGTHFVATGWGSSLYTSLDGFLWYPVHPGTGQNLFDLTYGQGGFVAVGHEGSQGVLLFSPNGLCWHLAARMPGWAMGVTWGKGRFVAVGERGLVALSTDGKRWQRIPHLPPKWLYGVAFGHNRFVAVGEVLLLSEDGLSWQSFPLPENHSLLGVTFGNGVFLAAGERGRLFASSDGLSWQTVLVGSTPWFKGLAYGNGRFVATGYGTVLVAQRGWDWEEVHAQHLPKYLPSVAYAEGRFALVGHPRPGNGVVAFSEDGHAWDDLHPLHTEPEAIAFGEGRWVVAGVCGTLLSGPSPR